MKAYENQIEQQRLAQEDLEERRSEFTEEAFNKLKRYGKFGFEEVKRNGDINLRVIKLEEIFDANEMDAGDVIKADVEYLDEVVNGYLDKIAEEVVK